MKYVKKALIPFAIMFAVIGGGFFTLLPARAACSGIVYVDASSTAVTPDGCTWGNAFPNLQDGLAIAASGDQVWVANGTYYPDRGGGETLGNRESTFTPTDGVAVYGGFAGGEADLGLRNSNPATNGTVLSGDIGAINDTSDNSYHVVTIGNVTSNTRLDGFTITGGNTGGALVDDFGGGIYMVESNVTLINLSIRENTAPNGRGGGIFMIFSSPTLSMIAFTNNTAVDGGGIGMLSSNPTINEVIFDGNIAVAGGGLFGQNSSPVLYEVIFRNNQATEDGGGGMHVGTLTNDDPPILPKLSNVTFNNNEARGGGGLFIGNSGDLTELSNITFSGNLAQRRGGAILIEYSNPVLENITFHNNVSFNTLGYPKGGGAIMNIASDPVFKNVTFSGNESMAYDDPDDDSLDHDGSGDAIYNVIDPNPGGTSTSDPVITNSILWDEGDEISGDSTGTTTISDSIVKGGFTGTNILTSDPQLIDLAENGGFTPTMAIPETSPAYNAGNNATCTATDQRGIVRPVGSACDMGAFELVTASLAMDKTSTSTGFAQVGDTLSYAYKVTNNGPVTVNQPFAVLDDNATVTCSSLPASLAPTEFFECTGSRTITQSDLDAGSVTNTAYATGDYLGLTITSNQDSVTITGTQTKSLALDKTSSSTGYNAVGNTLSYTYVITNTGNVTLSSPFTIDDDKSSNESCPATSSLAPGAELTCSASYAVTQADLDAGSVINTATAGGYFGADPVTSNQDSVTVSGTQTPALSLDKTSTSTGYNAVGNVLSYTYKLTNTGNVTLNETFSVTDDKVTVDCSSQPSTLAPGAFFNCTASYAVTQADLDAGSVTNTATAAAVFGGSPVTSNQDSLTITGTQTKTLALDKSSTSTGYNAVGNVLSYSYKLTNNGNVTLSGTFSVTDNKVTVDCSSQPGSLAPGAFFSCTASYTIIQADLDAGSVTNTATAGGFFAAAPVTSNQDSVTITGTQTKSLALDKSSTSTGYDGVGDTLSYTYVITNTGNVTLSSPFTVNDDKIGQQGCTSATSLAPGSDLTCTLDYTIVQADLDAGSVTNNATAAAVFGGDPVTSNQDSLTITGTQTPALSLDKTSTSTSYDAVGDVLPYSYKLTNTGNVTLNGTFSVTDDKVTVNCSGQPLTLAPGAFFNCTASYTIVLADLEAGSVTNTATAGGYFGAAPVTSNQDSLTINGTINPALTLNKTSATPNYDAVGDVLSYGYQITNSGNVTLSGTFSVTDDKTTVNCSSLPSTLAPGASFNCTAAYTVTQADLDAGSVTNTATADGFYGAVPVASNQDSVTINAVQRPALTLRKATSSLGYDQVGDTLNYTYAITNTGNVTLNGAVTFTDLVGAAPVSNNCPASINLAPGASAGCTGSYTVQAADITAGQVTNTAEISGNFYGDIVADQASVTVDQFLYTIAVTIDGNGTVPYTPGAYGGKYKYGDVVIFTPTGSPGWVFTGWSGPDAGLLVDNGNGTWTLTVASDVNIAASFKIRLFLPMILNNNAVSPDMAASRGRPASNHLKPIR